MVQSWAAKLIEEYRTSDPRLLAERLGIEIREEGSGQIGGLKRYSEYREKPSTIIIYRDQIGPAHAERIAHELFHHLEKIKLGRRLPGSEAGAAEFSRIFTFGD